MSAVEGFHRLGLDHEAYEAVTALTRALEALHPRRAPCQDPATDVDWFASTRTGREDAVRACEACPVLDACATYADAACERWGVWGGVDRESTPRPTRRRATT